MIASPLNAQSELKPAVFQARTYADRKSTSLAVLYSLVLPGAGEYYAENYSAAKFTMMGEGGLWLLYAGLYYSGNWVRNDARTFAAQHAGVQLGDKDEQFEVDLGNYLTSDEYNLDQLRNREFDKMYTAGTQQWSWDSDADRGFFRSRRIRSDEIHNYGKFVIAGMVVNRILSAFAAARAVNAFNQTLRADIDWQLQANPIAGLQGTHGLELRLSRNF